jgi:hypothetical protein
MREVLIDIIEAFPKYDLESDGGIEVAIQDLETKLGNLTVNILTEKDLEEQNRGLEK